MNHQVVTDYTDVNTENSSVCVYVRARPPDPSWTLEDDDASVEDKFQNPLQATLAGLSPKSNSGALSPTPQATSSAFITNFPDNPKKICIKDPAAQGSVKHHGETYFSFDRVFWTECSQEEIFQAVAKPQVENMISGFNGCCFAYGQTGSGKTYSMFGEGAGNSRGMIPRCMEEVFAQLDRKAKAKDVAVVVSFLEIYCDRVRDLGEAFMSHQGRKIDGLRTTSDVHEQMKSSRAESFQPRNKPGSWVGGAHPGAGGGHGGVWDSYPSMDLKIHEDVQGNVFVKDLSLIPVTTLEEVLQIISLGLRVRATHETKMNQVSSRSHTVFTVTVVQRDPHTDQTMTGMLNLVDLAGSERLKKSASEGQRKTEALHINSSLTALGKVVMALDPSSGLTHVPYRDSKLTRLLQNSLGGNSFTVLLATVHPIARFSEECLSTLQFANRCRSVHNHPRVNKLGDGAAGDQRKLKKLQDEVQALRVRLGTGGIGGGGPGGVSAEANARVVAVLAQMGFDGALELPDGSIRLPDGRTVGNFGLDGGGSSGDASASANGGVRGAYASAMLKGVSPDVRVMVQGLEGEVRGAKKKLKERKKELVSIQAQLESRRAAFVEGEKKSRLREIELVEQLAVAQAQLREAVATAARAKEEQLNAVIAGSQSLLRRQRRMLATAAGPSTNTGPERLTDSRTESDRERKTEEARNAQSLRALEFSKEVERENLKQRCDQLMRSEADGRTLANAKLESAKIRRDRKVRELSVELLLLHDHASSLRDFICSPGRGTPSSYEAVSVPCGNGDKVGKAGEGLLAPDTAADLVAARASTSNGLAPNQASLLPPPVLMLPSASLPCLSRLLRARGGVAPSSANPLDGRHHTKAQRSRSEAAIVLDAKKNGHGDLESCRGHTTRPRARARPRSAGVASRRSGSPSFPLSAGIGARTGSEQRGGGHGMSNTLSDKLEREGGVRRGRVARTRPVSAPGRRSWTPNSHGRLTGTCNGKQEPQQQQQQQQFNGPVVVNARGEGSVGAGREQARAALLGGWSAQDTVERHAGELSRGGLLCLVSALREDLRAANDGNQTQRHHDRHQVLLQGQQKQVPRQKMEECRPCLFCSTNGARAPEERGRLHPNTTLRAQTRRYNDLKVAYESLCRLLDSKGHGSASGGKTGRACSSSRLGRASHPGRPSLRSSGQRYIESSPPR